jgi:6-pyruvoyltetrahydropterin/6-carboxytetrahydropterin synthase
MARRFSIEVAKDYFNFAAAHFLLFADGAREALHGHNYQAAVAVEGELDRAGVVLDFITFKPLVKEVCDALDHRTLIQEKSPLLRIEKRAEEISIAYRGQRLILPRRDVVLLPLINTSTELLAQHLAAEIRKKLRQSFPAARLRWIEVAVEESRGQSGIYRGAF